MVQLHLGPRNFKCVAAIGAIAQLGEHLPCKQEVIGSIPIGSTYLILNEVKDPMQKEKSLAVKFSRFTFILSIVL